jgi:hypothetical protein
MTIMYDCFLSKQFDAMYSLHVMDDSFGSHPSIPDKRYLAAVVADACRGSEEVRELLEEELTQLR